MNRFPSAHFLLVSLLVLSNEGKAPSADQAELRRLVERHAAAVGSVHSIQFTTTYEGEGVLKAGSVKYWQAGDTLRMEFTHKLAVTTAVAKDGVVKTLSRSDVAHQLSPEHKKRGGPDIEQGRYMWHGARSAYKGFGHGIALWNPWDEAKFVVYDSATRSLLPFADFAKKHADRFRGLTKKTVGGVECVAAQFELDNGLWNYCFDPTANYLIKAVVRELKPTDPPLDSGSMVKRFQEVDKGVYFPVECEVFQIADDGRRLTGTIRFRDVVANKPIPDEKFKLTYRPGIVVRDFIDRVKYRVGEDEQPSGPKEPLGQLVPPNVPPVPGAPKPGEPPRTETKEEPPPAGQWVLPTSAALLASCGLAVGLRRWRSRNSQDD